MQLNSFSIICIISLHIFFSCNNKSNVGSNPSEELIEIDTLIPERKILISQSETAVANLIAGKDKSFFDSIITISDDYWNDFSSKIDNDFEKIYNDRLVHMSDWSNTDFISNSIDTSLVLYPFSGPDFLHVNYLYPNANEYILLAEVIDKYEVISKDLVDEEELNMNQTMNEIKRFISKPYNVESLKKQVSILNQWIVYWDDLVQPIQLSLRRRGLVHKQSRNIAYEIRSFANYISQCDMELAIGMISNLQNVFQEIVEVADLVSKDMDL